MGVAFGLCLGMFPSDTISMTRSSTLLSKFSQEETGVMAQWYVAFVFYRAYLSLAVVVHDETEQSLTDLEIHLGADMDLALDKGWITGYHIVRSRKTYPHTINTVRLFLPEHVDRSVWKRLLGNRAYDNVHAFAQEYAKAGSGLQRRQSVPAPKDNTYYGRQTPNGIIPPRS